MFHASLIALSLASAPEVCDLRATVAGNLMILHQSGATPVTLANAARGTLVPDFATNLVTRVVAAETSPDAFARELAAFHFAAKIYTECTLSGAGLTAGDAGPAYPPHGLT